MAKKGSGLALNTIIIAAIALVVLVVLIVIFTNYMQRANQDLNKPLSEAEKKAQDITWCFSSTIEGKECSVEAKTCAEIKCKPASIKKEGKECSYVCEGNDIHHMLAQGAEAHSCSDKNNRYCCCP